MSKHFIIVTFLTSIIILCAAVLLLTYISNIFLIILWNQLNFFCNIWLPIYGAIRPWSLSYYLLDRALIFISVMKWIRSCINLHVRQRKFNARLMPVDKFSNSDLFWWLWIKLVKAYPWQMILLVVLWPYYFTIIHAINILRQFCK